jgi:hypothetical protein
MFDFFKFAFNVNPLEECYELQRFRIVYFNIKKLNHQNIIDDKNIISNINAMEKENLKRITIKISKKITHFYDAEKKILVPIGPNNQYILSRHFEDSHFHLKLQLILPELKLNKISFVKKILQRLSPSQLADRIIELKKQYPQKSLKRILNDAEYKLIQEISSKIIGTDEEPEKIYEFLSSILRETSEQMDKHSQEFTYQLTKELQNKGYFNP